MSLSYGCCSSGCCSSVYVLLVAYCCKTLLVVIDRHFFLSTPFCHSCIPVSNTSIQMINHMIHHRNQPCNAVFGICHLWLAMVVDMTDMQLWDDAGVPPHQCISNFATQCLHNAIFLADQAAARCSSSQHQPQPPSDTPAGSNSLHNALSNPNGLPYPSNGHRGAIGATRGNVEEGSAAEAAEQLAMLSLDRSRATSGTSQTTLPSCVTSGLYVYVAQGVCDASVDQCVHHPKTADRSSTKVS